MIGEKQKEKLKKIFRESQIVLAYLFGSAARGQDGPLSDIDIAVLFSDKVKKNDYFDRGLEIADKIDRVLKTDKTEVVCLNEAPPLLKHRAVFSGSPLFFSSRESKREFELAVVQEYEDFNHYLTTAYRSLDKRIKEGDFGKLSLAPRQEKSFLKYVAR